MAPSTFLKENEKFDALFQFASMGILIADAKGEIILVNNFLLKQFGYDSASELVGKKVEQLIPSRYHHNHTKYRDSYNKHPEPRPMGVGLDLYAKKTDGSEFPVEISLSNYNSSEGRFVICFISDITKRKEVENAMLQQSEQLTAINKKIEELNDELEQKVETRTSQLQETLKELEESRNEIAKALSKEKELSDLKGRFVSMASHEFRTPLSTILSSASLLAKYTESEEQEKRDKHIHRIKSSVNNLTDILNEFLSIGKIEDGRIMAKYSVFNIKEMLTSICSEMQAIARKGQHIRYEHNGFEDVNLDPS
ncbi:MAG TPA: PAS domain S-box protein, partial [Ferruginibacter sp.]|nr:PAS domain S-box protein [Ferruginibacter sp.]